MNTVRLLVLLLPIFASIGTARASELLTPNVDLRCNQPETRTLHCDFRLLSSGASPNVSAYVGQTPLPVGSVTTYPWQGARTAILMLVDTSDPGRENVIRKNIDQIEDLVHAARPDDILGLASFDSDLRIVAPVGTPADKIISAARKLSATGMTTELFRCLLKAVDILAKVQADRRAIILFSDGQAEDKAYFLQDVSREARKTGVIINSLGFPRSVELSVALQTMRRLSQESGGIFMESDMRYDLPEGYASNMYSNLDRGGKFDVNLAPLMAGVSSIHLRFAATTAFDVEMPIALPIHNPAPSQAQEQAQAAPQPQVRVITEEAPATDADTTLTYGMPAALVVLIILALVTLVIVYRNTRSTPSGTTTARSAAPEYKPYAYLIAQDERKTRYPVTRTIWRIGRSSDNELTLSDNSVSRRHAEIQRTPEGVFVLLDRSSMNGVFVNGEKVGRRELKEGDIIEIGDIHLRFTESPADDALVDITSMQRTRTPSIP